MRENRAKKGYSTKEMALYCGVSETLIKMVENGLVTHPKLAQRIGKEYGLSKKDIYELMPENYRPGPNYNPDKYKAPEFTIKGVLIPRKSVDEKDVDGYISDNSHAIKTGGRRGVIK